MAIYTGTSSKNTKNEKQYRRHFVVCIILKVVMFYQSQVTNARIMNDSDPYINTEGVRNKGQHSIGGPSKNQLWALPLSKLFTLRLNVCRGRPAFNLCTCHKIMFYAVTLQLILNSLKSP